MKRFYRGYRKKEWYQFAAIIKKRDNYQCSNCGRTAEEAVLQVHHNRYVPGKEPWDYIYSDCITLCKGCHSSLHKITEPKTGWTLIAVNDLGGRDGICERIGCGTEIRYEHEIYHPDWGYKIVGSTCIDYLTQEDKALSSDILKLLKNISKFVDESYWQGGSTQKGRHFITTTYRHHILRIYGEGPKYGIQIGLVHPGNRYPSFKPYKIYDLETETLDRAKEAAYIALKGKLTEDEQEKVILRDFYKSLRK